METEQEKVEIRVSDLAFALFAAHEISETEDPSFDELDVAVWSSDAKVEVSAEVAKFAFWSARKYGIRFKDRRYDLGHGCG